VLKFLSVKSIVIAAANTGKDSKRSIAVIKTLQTNNGIIDIFKPGTLMFKIVTIKFIAPNIDDMPAKCKLNIAKSTAPPECANIPLKGGYTVQPVPAPVSINAEHNSNIKDGGNNQKLNAFSLGNAISGAPINKGTKQLPNPPIMLGITIKKIIINACAVTTTL
jgi:hypothetical protein